MLNFLFILMLTINPATQSDSLFVASDSLFDTTGFLNLGNQNGWRFHPGDDLKWANSDFDDSNWKFYKPAGVKANGGEIKVETKPARAGSDGESEGLPVRHTETTFIIHLPFN